MLGYDVLKTFTLMSPLFHVEMIITAVSQKWTYYKDLLYEFLF